MKSRRSVLASFVTLLTLVAFAMPAFAVLFYTIPAEASTTFDADCGTMVIKKADTAKNHQQSRSDKVGDNCCISHHCCAAKMVYVPAIISVAFAVTAVDLDILSNQHASGRIIHGLDRPPKSLV